MRTGIYPLDNKAISKESLIPAEVFFVSSECDKEDINIAQNENHSDDLQAELGSDVVDLNTDTCIDKQLNKNETDLNDNDIFGSKLKELFDTKRQKDKNIKKRRNDSEIVAGKHITERPIHSNLVSYREQSAPT